MSDPTGAAPRTEVPRCGYVCGLSERVHGDAHLLHEFRVAAPPEPPLDVERLRDAIDTHAAEECPYDACFGECAQPIADRYAASSTDTVHQWHGDDKPIGRVVAIHEDEAGVTIDVDRGPTPHPFIGEQRSPTHCLLFIEGGTCKLPPDHPVHLS